MTLGELRMALSNYPDDTLLMVREGRKTYSDLHIIREAEMRHRETRMPYKALLLLAPESELPLLGGKRM